MSNNTLEYYDKQCAAFVESTVHVDFTATQKKFLDRLPKNAHILDFGCGSGRDTKYFLERGFRVTAIDGSAELCKFASEYTGVAVKQIYFQNLADVAVYDGIWACSSILHLSYSELQDVFNKMVLALKEGGIIYTSFKYGTFEGERSSRYFTDMDEEKLQRFLKPVTNIKVEELWVSGDVRQGRGDEKWLNMILKK